MRRNNLRKASLTVVHLPTKDDRKLAETLVLIARVRARVLRLPPNQRKALTMIIRDGLSYQDAAERLGVSVAQFTKLLRVARALIGKMVEQDNADQQPLDSVVVLKSATPVSSPEFSPAIS